MKLHLSLVLVAALAGAALPACEIVSPSKVASGQLYVSGDGRYDPFFDAVHKHQVEAASWSDDRKAARKPITTAVSVPANASENTILESIRERSKSRAEADKLGGPIDEVKRADIDRAEKLLAVAAKLDELAKEGHNLSDGAKQEYEQRGAMRADEEKSERMRKVRRELVAATEVCEQLASDARKLAREADWFSDDMLLATEGKPRKPHSDKEPLRVEAKKAEEPKKDDEPKKGADAKKPEDAKKPAPAAKPAEAPKPKPAPAAKPAEAPKPAEKKPEGEVFNP